MSLDSGAVHNWRALVHHLHDYTIMDLRQLATIEQRVTPPPQLGIMGAWWGVRQYQVASKLLKESKTPLTIPLINGHPFPDWGGGGWSGGSSTVWLLSMLNVFKPHPYYIIVKSYITSKWKYLYRAHACNLWWFPFLFRTRVPLRVYSVTWTLAAGLYWI